MGKRRAVAYKLTHWRNENIVC